MLKWQKIREQKCKKSTQTDLFLSYVYMKLNILFHVSFILFRLLNHSTNTMIRFNKHSIRPLH